MKTPKKYELEIALEKAVKRVGLAIGKFFIYLSRVPKKKSDKMDKIAYLMEVFSFVFLLAALLIRR